MKNRLSLLLLFIFLIISSSCKHELETPSWDIDIITPLITTQVTIDQINIEELSSGLYLVKIYSDNGLSTIKKLVKK